LNEIIKLQRECTRTNTITLEHAMTSDLHLPDAQRENIMACLNAAKKFKGQGNRYTTRWIYHCLLLKIRSNKAYNYLRDNHIMALPSMETLRRYIRKMKPTYGFQPGIFEVMKEKSKDMDPFERRGKYFYQAQVLLFNIM